MKSEKPSTNKVTGMKVGSCVCRTCRFRNGRNFLGCQMRDKISADIILGEKECHFYKKDSSQT